MTLEGEFYRYTGAELLRSNILLDEVRLAAADSWLVNEGKVRSLQAHFDRFSHWVEAVAPQLLPSLPNFFELVREALPATGRWFPRIELHLASDPTDTEFGDFEDALYLRLREAPEQLGAITLWTLDEPDPRAQPLVKGPDLSLCMQLRRRAQLHAADEAVLITDAGLVAEGALSALVWWRGDVLCAPEQAVPWLPSVTRQEVFGIAQQMGYQTREEAIRPADLVGLEIWALSSLQGIRWVKDWVNLGAPVGAPVHFDAFEKRLRLLASKVN